MLHRIEPPNDNEMDASHLLSDDKPKRTAPPLCTLTVGPAQQLRATLGDYPPGHKLRGFSVEINPDPEPEGAIVTQITNLKVKGKYRLVLHVANYGIKTVTATAREL
ncbi:MAG TPA: hypothetical protein VIS56_00305 [Candidatus Saccharimonadales bacterium]